MFLALPLLAAPLRVQAQRLPIVPVAPVPLTTPITMTAQLPKTQFKADEPVVLTITLHNTGDKEVPLGGSAFEESSFDLDLRDERGQKVKRTLEGKSVLTPLRFTFRNIPLQIAAKGERKITFPLTQLFDLSAGGKFSLSVSRRFIVSFSPIKNNEYKANSVTLHAAPMKFSIKHAPAVRVDGALAPFSTTGKFVLAAEPNGPIRRFRVGEDGSLSATREDAAPVVPNTLKMVATPDGRFVYVVSGELAKDDSAIWGFAIGKDGRLSSLGAPTPLPLDYYTLALDSTRGRLISYSAYQHGHGFENGGRAFHIDANGGLQEVKGFELDGTTTLVLSPDGRLAFYASGPVLAFRVAPDGSFSRVTPMGWRVENAEAVNSFVSPDGKMLLVEAQSGLVDPQNKATGPLYGCALFRIHPDAAPTQVLERVPGLFFDHDAQDHAISTKPIGFDPSSQFVLAQTEKGALASFDVSDSHPFRAGRVEVNMDFNWNPTLSSTQTGLTFDADGHTFYTAGGFRVSAFRLRADGTIQPLGSPLRTSATSLTLATTSLSPVGSEGLQARLAREVATVGTPMPLNVRVAAPTSVEVSIMLQGSAWEVAHATPGLTPEPVPLRDAGRGVFPLRLQKGARLDLNRLFDLSRWGVYSVRVSAAGQTPVELTFEVDGED